MIWDLGPEAWETSSLNLSILFFANFLPTYDLISATYGPIYEGALLDGAF